MNINLTTTSYLVLGLIARMGTATPYELKRAVFHTIEYFWSFPHSQLYAEPERLKRAGYLEETREPGGRRRRSFSITEKGREALASWLREPTAEPVEIRDLGLLKLYFGELGSRDRVRVLAEQQTDLHRARLAEYEALYEARQDADEALAYPLAVLEMGILFEQAALAFWQAVAAAPPVVSRRLQPVLNLEPQPPRGMPRRQSRKPKSPAALEPDNLLVNVEQSLDGSFSETLSEEVVGSEISDESTRDALPDHLL